MRASGVALACAVAVVSLPAFAAERHRFAIPSAPLFRALQLAADQGKADIGSSEDLAAGAPLPALSGTMTTAAALRRLLDGSGFVATEVRPGAFRVTRATIRPQRSVTRAARPVPAAPAAAQDAAIIVTGSKRMVPLSRYAGAAAILPLRATPATQGRGIDSLVAKLPILQSTAFGQGRDKLFVRGIADSSFAGPTQSTVGSYFGETRLFYSGADPDLRLIDMDRVEILEGAQGTLYGAGAIGGIVRLLPTEPDPARTSGSIDAGIGTTHGGAASYDASAMLNLPVIGDSVAARGVAYHVRDGGYVAGLGRRAINGGTTDGGRLALHAAASATWTVDLHGLIQRTRTANPQYAVRRDGPLGYAAGLAQPFADDVVLGAATVQHRGGDAPDLLVTAGAVGRESALRYDAGRVGAPPRAYDERNHSRLLSAEVRLWRDLPTGSSWLVGVAAVQNRAVTRRQLGSLEAPRDISGVDNRSLDLALFGEGTLAIARGLSVTAGLRVTHARMDGQSLSARPDSPFIRGHSRTRADPTVAIAYVPVHGITWYARYGRGFRTGGLAVAAGVGRVATYEPDSIQVIETGLRFDSFLPRHFTASIAASRAWWQDVQADLIATTGFPFTANLGDARITTLEASARYTPVPRLELAVSGLFANSALVRPDPPLQRSAGDTLPDTPRASLAGSVAWTQPLGGTRSVRVAGDVRMQGRSRLGVGPFLGLDQAGYTAANLEATLRAGQGSLSLRLENLADTRGDRFAIGNPFQLRDGRQFTPLRPRTVRLALHRTF